MAKFDAKSFNERAFGKYMSAVPNVKLNKPRESGAIVGDAGQGRTKRYAYNGTGRLAGNTRDCKPSRWQHRKAK